MDQRTAQAPPQEQDEPASKPGEMIRIPEERRNKARVLIVMFFAVIFGALSDISLSKGMKTIGSTEFPSLYHAALAAITNLYVAGGVLMLIVFMVLYLVSLSWEDLSYVLPLTAGIYVLVTLLAYFVLHENVSPLRWTGSMFVATGIVLVTRT